MFNRMIKVKIFGKRECLTEWLKLRSLVRDNVQLNKINNDNAK